MGSKNCQLLVLLAVLSTTLGAVASAEEPFLLMALCPDASTGSIVRASMNGTVEQTILTKPDVWIYALAFDYENNVIFYSTDFEGRIRQDIWRCSWTGEEDTMLFAGVFAVGLAVDVTERNLYWANHEEHKIEVSSYSGENRRMFLPLLASDMYPSGLAVDLFDRRIYWLTNQHVYSANLDGTNVTAVKDGTGRAPLSMALDRARRQLYWSEIYTRTFHKLDLETGANTVILSGYDVRGIAVFNDSVYFNTHESRDGTLRKCGLLGEAPHSIMRDIIWPRDVKVVTGELAALTKPYLFMSRNASDVEARFLCRMPTPDQTYLVDWISGDSVIISAMRVSVREAEVSMTDLDPTKIKNDLSCRTRLVTDVNGTEQVGEVVQSNVLKPEVKVRTKQISLIEGQSTENVDVQFSMPPVFFNTNTFSLNVVLERQDSELRNYEKEVIDQVVVQAAEGSSTSSQLIINDSNWFEDHKFVIKALQDGMTDGTQRRTLRVNLAEMDDNGSVTKQSEIGKQEITVADRDTNSACKSWNDPRFRTFDGRYFSNHYEGEFVFYKNKLYDYQVNVMQARCLPSSTGTCNCAVAVRSYDDVIVLDKCSRSEPGDWRKSSLQIYILRDGSLSSGLSIWRLDDGYQHAVEFPHGGSLTVSSNSFGALQVTYKPVPEDYEQTMGLCGTYDSNTSNEFMMRDGTLLPPGASINDFTLEWRAANDERTFAGVEPSNVSNLPATFCSVLEGRKERCAPGLDKKVKVKSGTTNNQSILRKRGKDITDDLMRRSKFSPRPGFDMIITRNRKRRSTTSAPVQFDPFAPFAVNVSAQPQATVWPTASGLTEQQARDFCSQTLQFSTVQSCSTMTSDSYQELVNDCVDDIGLTDDMSWMNDTVTTIYDSCLTYLDSLDNSAEDGGEPPALPGGVQRNQITDNVCSGNCSGHGTCTDGACLCENGFTGYDCALAPTDAPEVSYLMDTLCDVNTRTCTEAIVFGDKFQDRSSLRCHLQEYTLGTPVPNTANIEVTASFLRYDQAACPIKKQKSYIIRVSNDGVHLSAERRLFVVYNSSCHECQIPGQDITSAFCQQKPSTCVIDGACHVDKVSNPNNNCEICDPGASNTAWTRSKDRHCVDGTFPIDLVPIIAVCAVAALLLLLGSVCTIYAIKKARSDHSGPSARQPMSSHMGRTNPTYEG